MPGLLLDEGIRNERGLFEVSLLHTVIFSLFEYK